MSGAPIVHISLPVRDLAEAERFYVDLFDAHVGRRRNDWIDVWTFGAQVTLHLAPEAVLPVDAQGHRHFGAVVDAHTWRRLADRATAMGVQFVRPILTERAGAADEQSKFMVADPSGNHVEVKTYPNPAAALEAPERESAR